MINIEVIVFIKFQIKLLPAIYLSTLKNLFFLYSIMLYLIHVNDRITPTPLGNSPLCTLSALVAYEVNKF